ncbi:MAG: hypothetical protein E7312_04070 [Clostridiales bacterium]|nr:hypothetical protein [Clostridiales bacterium]
MKKKKQLDIDDRKIIIYIATALEFVAVIALRLFMLNDMEQSGKLPVFYCALAVLLIGYFVLIRRVWRCPSCGKYLGKIDIGMKSCKYCGEDFNKPLQNVKLKRVNKKSKKK